MRLDFAGDVVAHLLARHQLAQVGGRQVEVARGMPLEAPAAHELLDECLEVGVADGNNVHGDSVAGG